jgi:hypothetical protein
MKANTSTSQPLLSRQAQSVARRGALKKFGAGLVGVALATLGVANRTEATGVPRSRNCNLCIYPYGCTTSVCISAFTARCMRGCC